MNCNQAQNNMIFYKAGDLDAKQAELFTQHITNCKNCQYLFNQLSTSLDFLESDKVTESNPFFYSRLQENLKQAKESKPFFWLLPAKQYFIKYMSYSLLIVFALFIGSYLGGSNTIINQSYIEEPNELSDHELFVASYNLQLSDDDIYIVTAEENQE